ncbi:MAG: 30S ribosomal protein S9 [Candidatus Omnitrophica bacterium]|nr:30S ribosomal protein S9 [Candidatus Omnitrophota bacterium]
MTDDKAFYATGRRKEAVARVWLFRDQKGFTVNGREVKDYLTQQHLQVMVDQPMKITKLADQFRIRVNVCGGGIAGQAGAIQLGISRALLSYDDNLRSSLRRAGFLTRDPREKERKKVGRKGARKRFQYTKR